MNVRFRWMSSGWMCRRQVPASFSLRLSVSVNGRMTIRLYTRHSIYQSVIYTQKHKYIYFEVSGQIKIWPVFNKKVQHFCTDKWQFGRIQIIWLSPFKQKCKLNLKPWKYTGVCSFCCEISRELTKTWSSGTTECWVWIGNCNVKVWNSTEQKLHNIWNSKYFCQISDIENELRNEKLNFLIKSH